MNLNKTSLRKRISISFLALLQFALTGIAYAQADPQAQSMKPAEARQNASEMATARKKRAAVFSKRHNMRDAKTRAEVVRRLKEAEDELQTLVHRRAKSKGLEIEGTRSDGGRFRLVDFDERGFPVYDVDQNTNAAISTAADQVRDSTIFHPPVPEELVRVEAEVAYPDNQSGIRTQTSSDTGGGEHIAYIVDGDWAEYTIEIPEAGEYILKFRTSSKSNNGGTINLSANGISIGSVVVPDTDDWNTWTTVRTQVVFASAGTQTLRTDFSGGSGSLFNINWFSYTPYYDTVTIGLWEAGSTPLLTHREIVGKVSIMDGTSTPSDHATHVAGTLVSRGIDSRTLGMAPEASIAAFDSSYATTEMMAHGAAEPGTTDLYLSNHSYGSAAGWLYYYNAWHFHGTFVDDGDSSSDYEGSFGRYSSRSEEWDGIAYSLPYYQIFAGAGNARVDTTPDEGETWKYGSGVDEVEYVYNSSQHPLSNRGYKGGWDNMASGSLAKNAITVGNANDAVTNGVRDVGAASAYSTSSRGPADDGRIKPDIFGNGVQVISCSAGSDTEIATLSGTSMACPNVCGSAALLIDYYSSRFPGGAMRASTLKGLILHTADDRGNLGPDYKYGWGIMNTKTAADVIKQHADNTGGALMLESTVNNSTNTSRTHSFGSDGTTPLRVTLCWTDPPGTEKTGHDNRAKDLVNDLNLKVTGPSGTHYPYVMPYVGDWSLAKIDDAATTGVNNVDPIEQVYLITPAAGSYTVTVDYTGSLTDDLQNYSLVVTGQTAAEIEVEYDGPPLAALTDNSGVQDFGATAASQTSVVRAYTVRNTGGSPLTDLEITKSGSHEDDFTVSSLSSTELATGQTASFTVTCDPLGTGVRTAALKLESNDADESVFDIHLVATGLSELEAWRLTNFDTTEGTGNFANNFDLDQDGVPNLTEFLFATNPTKSDSGSITATSDATTAELFYTRNVHAMADYTFQLMWADDLTQEIWFVSSEIEAILSDDGSVQEVKVTVPIGSSSKRFFRVQVSPK